MTLAHSSDPFVRWCLADPHQFISMFMPFVGLYGGKAFDHGSAYIVGGFEGVALWLPPDVGPDEEAVAKHCEQHIPEPKLGQVFAFFEKAGGYHPPEPHWYLPPATNVCMPSHSLQ